tara:strand:+ start:78 stop:203 length:126 start_codon:yes stop_codon:yes gene_type:complete
LVPHEWRAIADATNGNQIRQLQALSGQDDGIAEASESQKGK